MSVPALGVLPAPRHLVVRLPRPLGDAVMATPALRALRAALPSTRITWAGAPAATRALEGLPWRDDAMPLAGPMDRGVLAPWRAARLLRPLGADATLILPNSFATALAARLARIPVRVGTPLHGRALLLTRPVIVPTKGAGLAPRPMREHYLDLVAVFGARDDGRGTELATTDFDESRAQARLKDVEPGTRLLAVNAGASFGPTKVYPPDRLARAVSLVREEAGVLPLVLAGPGEEALARAVAEALWPPYLSVHDDPPDVGELKALLRRATLLLTTDAGPRHVAEAFGVPTVAVLGPTDPRWGAGGPSTVVRNEAVPCLGCHLRACPIGHPCMLELEPEQVARACLDRLSSPIPG
jgi:lipopolysaccharide heptosyltransferase II